jgi:ATP-dependent DNA helicase RecQ
MADLEETLRRFGHAAFRPWQREAIDALLTGPRRVLVVAPTGGGKSLCYQLPALVLEGTSVVVSPLIALMDDQVRALRQRGIAASFLASTLPPDERRRRTEELVAGAYKLIYVAPERLQSHTLVNLLARLRPPLLAVDEAHCISHWGHDFRPDYLRLGALSEALAPQRVLACTATATPDVRSEILERLGMPRDTHVVLRGFARPNLHLEVREIEGMAPRLTVARKKISQVLGRPGSSQPAGRALVYAGTRRLTDKMARTLTGDGWRVAGYHAGLEARERDVISARFAGGELDVVVATNAFGMGIDRADIRLVVHVQAPGSLEQYYQEVGRAGRDGDPAHGLLLSGSSDFGLRKSLIARSQDQAVGERGGDPRDVSYADRQWRLFLSLMRYVEAGSCRHDFILRYFGDEQEVLGGCGHCDVCAIDEDGESEDKVEDDLVVRKALAGVARLRGRAGLKALADSLAGNETQRVRELGISGLSTHAILRGHPPGWVLALLRRLLTAGLVDVTPGDFPVPFLTPTGWAVMRSERELRVLLPRAQATAPADRRQAAARRARPRAAEIAPRHAALFERLRHARLEAARASAVPPYVVCHDRTLVAIAERQPRTLAELAEVDGMGPLRIERYGERLLTALRERE